MPELAKFQKSAVDRIVKRLGDRSGSGRYLLADEVGLGKTLVARGVIEGLAEKAKRNGRTFTVIYICSNTEIGEQNRGKLVEESAGFPFSNKRLTLLPLYSNEISEALEKSPVQLFSFTPGTSLKIGREKEGHILIINYSLEGSHGSESFFS